MPRRDLDAWEGRLEYWDGDTETAWVVCEPVGVAHEHPLGRLATLCMLIAEVRGAAIEFLGSTDLELQDEHGERQKIMQADQCMYLYPGRARLPEDGGMVVRKKGWAKAVRGMLLSRGIAVSEEFPVNVPGFAQSREDVVIAAAFACGGEEDFRARIRGG